MPRSHDVEAEPSEQIGNAQAQLQLQPQSSFSLADDHNFARQTVLMLVATAEAAGATFSRRQNAQIDYALVVLDADAE